MNKALVIGTGSVAKKHILNLNKLNYKVFIFSKSKNKIKLTNKKIKLNYIYSLKHLNRYEFVILANATCERMKYLKILVKNRMNIYCEKPIYHKKFNYVSLIKNIKKNKILFFTGYQLLQHEKIQFLKRTLKKEKVLSFNMEVGHNLEKWRSGKINNKRYFLNKNKGGGVIFELIHEINLIQNLFGKIIFIKSLKKKSKKINNFEDLVVSLIKVKNDIVGLLHQDMISNVPYRRIKILTKNKLFNLNIAQNIFKINDKKFKFKVSNNTHQVLLKKNLMLFIKLLKNKTRTTAYLEQSISDLKIALKMH